MKLKCVSWNQRILDFTLRVLLQFFFNYCNTKHRHTSFVKLKNLLIDQCSSILLGPWLLSVVYGEIKGVFACCMFPNPF